MIYLASRSPRRRDLLNQLGVSFEILDMEVDESARAGETADALVRRLATAKAETGRRLLDADGAHLVLGADTIVVLDNEVLGKPRDPGRRLRGADGRQPCRIFLLRSGGWQTG